MKNWLEIRNTGVSILDILELLSKGNSFKEVLKKYPQLTPQDIKYTAFAAHDFIIRHLVFDTIFEINHKMDRIFIDLQSIISERNQNKLLKWSKDEDNELVYLFQSGGKFKDIASILQRPQNNIKARLKELGLLK
ncbi:MAG: DUF433 domain-containing protein [Candidatus Zixiibacteriota bacterium]